MLFTLVTAMQEKLSERADQIKTVREEKQQKEAEAAGKQLFHGIPDTVENFLSWKAKFDAELLEIKKVKIIFRDDFWPFTFCTSASFSINILMSCAFRNAEVVSDTRDIQMLSRSLMAALVNLVVIIK